MQGQHEVDQRTFELRASAQEHRETGTGNLRRALEIEDAEGSAEIPMRFRLEIEGARLAPRPHDDVVFGALPGRHAVVWNIGDRLQQAAALTLDRVELDLELLDALRALLVGFEDRPGIEP